MTVVYGASWSLIFSLEAQASRREGGRSLSAADRVSRPGFRALAFLCKATYIDDGGTSKSG